MKPFRQQSEPAHEPPPAGASGGSDVPVETLLLRASRGDQAAFATLYDATARRVHGLVLRVVRNPAHAEEVTQEVYLDAWRNAAGFDAERGSVIAWLLTLAHRRAVDRVRAAEAAGRRDTNYHFTNQPVLHDSTAEAAHDQLEARRLRVALDQLTHVQRQALELAYFDGYTHTEVATLLDLPLGTAKTRIRDALIRLRDNWGVAQ